MRLLFTLLLPIFSFAQTWPTKECVDTPYTKGNDGIIYHTGKSQTGRIVKDSMYCYMCKKITTREHVMERVLVGTLKTGIDSNGIHQPTPLGIWMKKNNISFQESFNPSVIPKELKKYLPADYYINSEQYFTTLTNTE